MWPNWVFYLYMLILKNNKKYMYTYFIFDHLHDNSRRIEQNIATVHNFFYKRPCLRHFLYNKAEKRTKSEKHEWTLKAISNALSVYVSTNLIKTSPPLARRYEKSEHLQAIASSFINDSPKAQVSDGIKSVFDFINL